MSLAGLLGEVKNFHPHHLEVALGEQVLNGNKRVFSDVKPGTSASTSAGAGNKKEGKGAKNELKGAIDNAKNIASKALREGGNSGSNDGVASLRNEHNDLAAKVEKLTKLVAELQLELSSLRQGKTAAAAASAPAPAATKAAEPAAASDAEEEDDFDLFGSDDEDDAEKKKVVEERLKAYNEKKSKKPGPIAKSSVILDVKPWDDETNMEEMEKLVRSIEMDGLVWGGAKLIPIGYGIKKLQIISVIEDLKVSVDDLIEKITGDFEDHVQSVDIAAFNKI